jgi:hypothetical protein
MAHPYHHALSSVKKWGGTVNDYQPIHAWYDSSKAHSADFRHRAMFHHAAGIWLSETVFGPTITLSTGRVIPTRWVGEQHVREDLGFIPSFTDWVKAIRPEPWMGRTEKIEALVDPHQVPPLVEVRGNEPSIPQSRRLARDHVTRDAAYRHRSPASRHARRLQLARGA